MNQTVAFHTLGCKVNYFESEGVWENFSQAGYERVEFTEVADVYVINTCSVTNGGDKKSRQFIRRAIRLNPDAVVCVMGCFAQTQTDAVLELEGVDIILGTNGRSQLVGLVEKFQLTRQPINIVGKIHREREFETLTVSKFENRKRGVLKIQDGCDNFCTFCIIPWARGRVRSEQPEIVLAQAAELVKNGHVELVLTGIHTGAYGEDLDNYLMVDLIRDLIKIDGLKRIRISSIEATQLTNELLEVLASSDKIAYHLHIPIQSGSNEILTAMKRKYQLDEFEENIKRIRKIMPNVSITTDIIVGFPGETEELFAESLATVKRIEFSELHVFPYSVRTGTVAARMDNHIPEITKTMRVSQMITVGEELSRTYAKSHEGQTLEVIVEQIKDGYATGHASNYLKIKFPVGPNFDDTIANVKIIHAGYPICSGELV